MIAPTGAALKRGPGIWCCELYPAERACILRLLPWLEGRALEGPLKACGSPRILHLATHGFFLENQPHDPEQGRRGFGRMLGTGLENPLAGPRPSRHGTRDALGLRHGLG